MLMSIITMIPETVSVIKNRINITESQYVKTILGNRSGKISQEDATLILLKRNLHILQGFNRFLNSMSDKNGIQESLKKSAIAILNTMVENLKEEGIEAKITKVSESYIEIQFTMPIEHREVLEFNPDTSRWEIYEMGD